MVDAGPEPTYVEKMRVPPPPPSPWGLISTQRWVRFLQVSDRIRYQQILSHLRGNAQCGSSSTFIFIML